MNPSYECMRVAREESRAELLEMRRWDVSRRLKALQLPESGSHDMLSRIAKVIYPTTTGWTHEACEYLRDQLVDLIGGERDAQHGCSGGAGGCVRRDVQEEVGGQSRTCPESGLDVSESDDGASITSELREYLDLNGQEFTNYKDELIATISGGTSALYAIADRIDEQYEVTQKQIADLERECESLQAMVERRNVKCRTYRCHIDQMKGGSKRWREKCAKLEEENRGLKAALSCLEVDFKRIRSLASQIIDHTHDKETAADE